MNEPTEEQLLDAANLALLLEEQDLDPEVDAAARRRAATLLRVAL